AVRCNRACGRRTYLGGGSISSSRTAPKRDPQIRRCSWWRWHSRLCQGGTSPGRSPAVNSARDTVIVSAATGVGFLLSLFTQVAFVSVFGVSRNTDVYFVAIALPTAVASIVGGAVANVLVPLFASDLTRGFLRKGWDAAASL